MWCITCFCLRKSAKGSLCNIYLGDNVLIPFPNFFVVNTESSDFDQSFNSPFNSELIDIFDSS